MSPRERSVCRCKLNGLRVQVEVRDDERLADKSIYSESLVIERSGLTDRSSQKSTAGSGFICCLGYLYYIYPQITNIKLNIMQYNQRRAR